jgi:hypothetical protein
LFCPRTEQVCRKSPELNGGGANVADRRCKGNRHRLRYTGKSSPPESNPGPVMNGEKHASEAPYVSFLSGIHVHYSTTALILSDPCIKEISLKPSLEVAQGRVLRGQDSLLKGLAPSLSARCQAGYGYIVIQLCNYRELKSCRSLFSSKTWTTILVHNAGLNVQYRGPIQHVQTFYPYDIVLYFQHL